MANRTCSAPGCDRKFYAKTWCNLHYNRMRKHGNFERPSAYGKPCNIEGCDRLTAPGSGRGMCGMHYQRWANHGDPMHVTPRIRRVDIDTCVIPGCAGIIQARGWCSKHWSRWDRYGSPTARMPGEIVDGKKVCPMCRVDKPLSDYSAADSSYCRHCAADRVRLRRVAMIGDGSEHFTSLSIFERDGWICGLCSDPIDKSLAAPNMMRVSLDHIIPISLGGKHTRDNTQAAHLLCNIRKGNRIAA